MSEGYAGPEVAGQVITDKRSRGLQAVCITRTTSLKGPFTEEADVTGSVSATENGLSSLLAFFLLRHIRTTRPTLATRGYETNAAHVFIRRHAVTRTVNEKIRYKGS